MKKKIGLAVLVLSVLAGICLLYFGRGQVRYSECIEAADAFEAIMDGRSAVLGLPSGLVFDEQILQYDAGTGTYYYSLVQGEKGAYDPHIRIQSREKGVKIAFLKERITDEVIADNTGIPFILYTDKAYARYTLKCTTLPVMNIEYGEGQIGEDVAAMHMTLFDNADGAVNRVTVSDGTIHVRGNTTKAFPKKGYRLSLIQESVGGHTRFNQVSLLGMRQDDDWILYPAYNDQEKVRNVFCANLWKYSCARDNAQGIDTGMEYKYLELFMNGEYWGLYALGYPIDEKQMMMDPASPGEGLYKSVIWYTDGNISFTEGGNPVGFRIKGTISEADKKWEPLLDYYYSLWEKRDDTVGLYRGIDIDNAINIYLFFDLIQGGDNVSGKNIKNLYLAVREGEDGPTALYAPWDMDLTWGNWFANDLSVNLVTPYALGPSNHVLMQSGYLNQILVNGDKAAWDKIYEKYTELRGTAWSWEAIGAMLDEYEREIYLSGAYLREMDRWPDGTYADAADGLNTFRSYVQERLREMDRYYEELDRTHEDGRTGYELQVQLDTFTDAVFYLQALRYVDHTVILKLNDPAVLQDERYAASFAALGVTPENTDAAGSVFVLCGSGEDRSVRGQEALTEVQKAYWADRSDNGASVRVTVMDPGTDTVLDDVMLRYEAFDERDADATMLTLCR